jgi:hypothetical protein
LLACSGQRLSISTRSTLTVTATGACANAELDVLYCNRSAMGDFNETGFPPKGFYWLSTLYRECAEWSQKFRDGATEAHVKPAPVAVRGANTPEQPPTHSSSSGGSASKPNPNLRSVDRNEADTWAMFHNDL